MLYPRPASWAGHLRDGTPTRNVVAYHRVSFEGIMSKKAEPPSMKSLPPNLKIDAGVRRAYQMYGPDLNAFFSAVSAELLKRAESEVAKQDARFEKSR